MTTSPKSDLDFIAETQAATHDVRDRCRNNMDAALTALANCVTDLTTYAESPAVIPGVAYSVAERLQRLSNELALFRARDLLNTRKTDQ